MTTPTYLATGATGTTGRRGPLTQDHRDGRARPVVKVLLVVAGAVAVVIGAAVLLAPVAFSESYGIVLGVDPDALSERRAPGAGLLVIGALLVAGAFVARLRFTALLVGTLVYLAYGVARVLSLVVDGRPTDGLLVAGAVELAIGAACLVALVRSVRDEPHEAAYAR